MNNPRRINSHGAQLRGNLARALVGLVSLMPVLRVNSLAAASHQGASVLHSALTTPCAWAPVADSAASATAAATWWRGGNVIGIAIGLAPCVLS